MPVAHKVTLKELFESRITITPGCWIWNRCRTKAGYGMVVYHTKKLYAHRVSYELYNGDIPDGHYVMHKCDNPACVNPDHLTTGTARDNARDMLEKGRNRYTTLSGEDCRKAKLTELEVFGIRNSKGSQREIAKRFGVHQSTVMRILQGRTWKDIL